MGRTWSLHFSPSSELKVESFFLGVCSWTQSQGTRPWLHDESPLTNWVCCSSHSSETSRHTGWSGLWWISTISVCWPSAPARASSWLGKRYSKRASRNLWHLSACTIRSTSPHWSTLGHLPFAIASWSTRMRLSVSSRRWPKWPWWCLDRSRLMTLRGLSSPLPLKSNRCHLRQLLC